MADAEKELAALTSIAADTTLNEYRIFDKNSVGEVLAIAKEVASGEIAAAKGETDKAVEHLNEAVRLEDSMRYTEPSDWPASTRHTLGRVLLNAGKYREAEIQFKEDLAIYPENGWALQGLLKCHEAMEEKEAAADVKARLEKAWAHADIEVGSVGL